MDGGKIVAIDLDAHLDPDIVDIIDIPGAGVAYHLAVRRLGEQRALPECLGQGFKAERGEKALSRLDHLHGIIILGDQQFGRIIADVAGPFRCNDIVNIAPFLRPHIAKQIGTDRAGRRLHLIAIFFVQLFTGVAMKLVVQRLDLRP
jgi:hypothetical protein